MSASAVTTLINPLNGHLAFKIFPFGDNSHFDHLQRLNYYSAILVTRGQGQLRADFSDYPFSASSLMFFAPYQPFLLTVPDEIAGVALHFHPDFFCIHKHQKEVACHGVLFNNIYQSPVLSLSPGDTDAFLSIIDQMRAEMTDPGLAHHELLVSHLKIFLIRATRLRKEQDAAIAVSSAGAANSAGAESSANTGNSPDNDEAAATDNRKAHIAQELKDAIENHYRTRHSASDYASLLNISLKVLAKIAKTYFNKTITDLISERIVIEAKRELYLTSNTVKEIAWQLGFEDEYYFSRFFKINADVSPQLFRETVGFARSQS